MTRFKQYHIWIIIILLTAGYNLCFAITANELKGLMEKNAQITIIDARSRSAFAQGHILNAINIPCDILKNKPLPPIGNVVVYGDGLKKDIQTAVDALNGQQGIDADILKGDTLCGLTRIMTEFRNLALKRICLPLSPTRC